MAKSSTRRSISFSEHSPNNISSKRQNIISVQLTPIPGSPYASDTSTSQSLLSKHSSAPETNKNLSIPKEQDLPTSVEQVSLDYHSHPSESISRARSKSSSYTSHHLQPPQSLDAALEILSSQSDRGHQKSIGEDWTITSTNPGRSSLEDIPVTPTILSPRDIPPSPLRPVPDTPTHQPTVGGKVISSPILNHGMHLIPYSLLHSLMLLLLCSRNLTNEPREKSRYRKTSIGRTCNSCLSPNYINGDPWIWVGLFQFP